MFFLLPIGHEDHSVRRLPWVTIAILIICVLVQGYSSFALTDEREELGQLMEQIAELQMELLQERLQEVEDPAEAVENMEDAERWMAELRTAEDASDDPLLEELAELEAKAEPLLNADPIYRFGYRPAKDGPFRMVTAAFVHGGWLHLIGNMLFLYLVGCNLEDRWGRLVFSLFYVVGAIAAAAAYMVWHPNSMTPMVGASGAVAAAMGAFLVCFALTKIRLAYFWLSFVGVRTGTFLAPAYVVLPLWFLGELFSSWIELEMGSTVAYSAHVGGFLFGGVAAGVLKVTGADQHLEAQAEKATEVYSADADHIQAREPVDQAGGELALAPLLALVARNPTNWQARRDVVLAAMGAGDLAVVADNVGAAVEGIARAGDDEQIVALYRALTRKCPALSFDDALLAQFARSAKDRGEGQLAISITNRLLKEHPNSQLIPRAMWDTAQAQTSMGRADLAAKTLAALAENYPMDPFAGEARRRLGLSSTPP